MKHNFISAIIKLKEAQEFLKDFIRAAPDSRGGNLAKKYSDRIEWIAKDLITQPVFPQVVRDGIRAEWESDIFVVPAIHEKIIALSPDKRELVETVIDMLISGEEFNFIKKD